LLKEAYFGPFSEFSRATSTFYRQTGSGFVLRTPKYIFPENFNTIGEGQQSNLPKIYQFLRFQHFKSLIINKFQTKNQPLSRKKNPVKTFREPVKRIIRSNVHIRPYMTFDQMRFNPIAIRTLRPQFDQKLFLPSKNSQGNHQIPITAFTALSPDISISIASHSVQTK
jgi:hypothetical protein